LKLILAIRYLLFLIIAGIWYNYIALLQVGKFLLEAHLLGMLWLRQEILLINSKQEFLKVAFLKNNLSIGLPIEID